MMGNSNITYLKKTKAFQNKHLPKIIEKFNLVTLPLDNVGIQYIGDGLNIIVDKNEVRIDVYRKDIDFSMEEVACK